MMRRLSVPRVVWLACVVFPLVSACGDSGEDAGETTVAPTTAAASTTEVATTTAPSPPSTTVADEAGLPGPGEAWDLLMLGDEIDLGVDTAALYGEWISESVGVEVNVKQAAGVEWFASFLLEHIRDERYPGIGDLVRQAEVIVLTAFPERSDEDWPAAIDEDSENCSYYASASEPKPPKRTDNTYWEPYRALLDEIYAEIWNLRDGAPTVLITTDLPNRFVRNQRDAGIFEECRAWADAWSAEVQAIGEQHGVKVVVLSDVLGGPDHDVDPRDVGYVGPSDAYPVLSFYTPNEVGSVMVAEALEAAGLEPWGGPSR